MEKLGELFDLASSKLFSYLVGEADLTEKQFYQFAKLLEIYLKSVPYRNKFTKEVESLQAQIEEVKSIVYQKLSKKMKEDANVNGESK